MASTESLPPLEHAFERDLRSGHERLDEQRVAFLRAGGRDSGGAGRIAPARRHAASRPGGSSARITPRLAGQRERLHHAGEFDSRELRAEGAAQIHPPYRGDGQPGRREGGAGKVLAAGDRGRGRRIVREPEGGGGPVRDLDGAVVGGDDPGDGPVAMRGDDLFDDGVGVTEIDPEPVLDAGNQRVLALARDQHPDAQIARRLQVGVHPVAAGRGDQQDPGRGVLHPMGAGPQFVTNSRLQPPRRRREGANR